MRYKLYASDEGTFYIFDVLNDCVIGKIQNKETGIYLVDALNDVKEEEPYTIH